MKKAVIYARFSSSKQREESIEGQVRECNAFAEREGYTVVKIYADRSITGRTDKRPEFQRMIDDASRRTFDTVLIYKYDRFARDRYAFAVYEYKLAKYDINVISIREPVGDGAASVIFKSMLQGMAEWYSLDLSEKITRGMTENALKGRWASGGIPVGYKRDADKKLVLDEKRAPYVAKIFEMFLQGERYVDITAYLNGNGVTNSKGRPFNAGSYIRILTNPVYKGVFRWKNVVIEDGVPALISKDVFDAVQHKLVADKRRGINVVKSDKYLLTPNIICAECGGAMNGMSGKNHDGDMYYYYVCANKRAKKTRCQIKPIPRDELEDAVFEHVCKVLADEETRQLIADQVMEVATAHKDEVLANMKRNHRRLRNTIDNYAAAIAQGAISGTIIENLNKAEEELQQLDIDIAKRELLAKPTAVSREKVLFYLDRIARLAKGKAKEEIFRSIIKNVLVEKLENPPAEQNACTKALARKTKKDSDERYLITVQFNYTDSVGSTAMQSFELVREDFQMVNQIKIFANYFQTSFVFKKSRKRRGAV